MVAALSGRTDVFDTAYLAHRRFQQGRGSGADIAASCHGGLVEYRTEPRTIRGATWPDGVEARCISTGSSASTPRFLEALDANEAAARPIIQEMGHVAREAGESDQWVALSRQSFVLMDALGGAMKMPVVSPPHRALAAIAAELNVGYKPSGAGGGDMGVVFGDDTDRLDQFVSRAAAAGYPPVSMALDPEGVRFESYPEP